MGTEQREGFDLQRHEPVGGQRLGHIETQPQRRQVKSGWFDAVGISVSSDRHLDTLAALLPKLRESSDNLGLQVFVGGPMAFIAPERLQGLAAEVLAEDAPATVSRITQAMAGAPARAN